MKRTPVTRNQTVHCTLSLNCSLIITRRRRNNSYKALYKHLMTKTTLTYILPHLDKVASTARGAALPSPDDAFGAGIDTV